jgi:hypothetical protein
VSPDENLEKVKETQKEGECLIAICASSIKCALVRGAKTDIWSIDIQNIDVDASSSLMDAIGGLRAVIRKSASLETGAKPKRVSISVLISDNWLAHTTLPWSDAIRSRKSDQFARSCLAASGVVTGSADPVRIADDAFGEPRLCVAYRAQYVDELSQLASEINGRLDFILPLSIAAWSYVRREEKGMNAFAVVDKGAITLGYGSQSLQEVWVRSGNNDKTDDLNESAIELQRLWQRAKLRNPHFHNLNKLYVVNLLSSDIPLPSESYIQIDTGKLRRAEVLLSPALLLAANIRKSCAHSLNVVATPKRMSPSALAVSLIALIVALGLSAQAWNKQQQIKRITDRRAAEIVARSARPFQVSLSKEEIVKAKAYNAAIRELNLPIASLLRALQPPADIQVAVLSVDTGSDVADDDQGAVVKIIGEAKSGTDMTRYVSFVSDRRPFSMAYLTHHEIDDARAERPYRFSLEARWSQ